MYSNKAGPLKIFEVGPRDGLQSESSTLTLDQRFNLICSLIEAGLHQVEVGSFVREDKIPQLAQTRLLLQKLRKHFGDKKKLEFWAFVPNELGLEKALEAGVSGVSFFTSVSDTFCKKNVNKDKVDQMKLLPGLIRLSKKNKVKHRVYLSTSFHCPFEGYTPAKKLYADVKALVEMGAQEISVSDTTGMASPLMIRTHVGSLLKKIPSKKIALHFHDTRALALPNILESINIGISKFDSSVGGLGGCPYAPGATGNVSTEEVLYLFQRLGYLKKINLDKVKEAAQSLETILGRPLSSKIYKVKT